MELCTFSHIIIFYSFFRTLSIQMTNIQQHIGIVFFFRTFELYRSKSNENFFINILTMSFSLLFIFPFVLYRSKSNENFFIDTLTNDALFQLSFIQTKRIILDNVGIVYIFPYNYLLFFLSYFIDPNNEYSTTYWNCFFFFFRTFELYRSKSNENFCPFLYLLLSLSYFIDPNRTKTTIRQYQIAFTLRLFQPLSIPIPFSISCAFYRIEPKEREEREHQTKIGHLANVCSYRIVFSFRKRAVKK